MGKMSRTKGATGEREVADMLSSIYPDTCRELDQYQGKLGRDLRGCNPWCVQIKRQKVVTEWDKRKAYEEAVTAEDQHTYLFPVVFYREDRRQWRVYTSLDALMDWKVGLGESDEYDFGLMVDMDAIEFIAWLDGGR